MSDTSTVFRLGKSRRRSRLMLALAMLSASGCTSGLGPQPDVAPGPHDTVASYHDHVGLKIEYPQVQECASAPGQAAQSTQAPLTFDDPATLPTYDLTLEEAVQTAIGRSPVLRSIGGSVVQTPQGTGTIYDPSLSYANPLGGVDAALSEFDAQVLGALNWNHNEFPNNVQRGGLGAAFNPPSTMQVLSNFRTEVAKQTATGGRFALRHIVTYDRNNRPFRQFPSDYTGWVEAEWRQPLLQGSGTTFNRIAGPNSQIGQYNGVLIARVNTDVSLTDFEATVIQLTADVEQAYWELYGAYRVLEARLRARESALKTYQGVEFRVRVGTEASGELAQAASQYFLFASEVENALAASNGVYALEQRLRYLMGLPAADGRLIKPISSPQNAQVIYDWESALDQALERRVEIRRQQWLVKRRELELIAARLNRRPRLDFLGTYRWRGLGDHLIGDSDKEQFDNLYGSITSGNYQEWTAGMELSFPVGLRRASVAVSHAQLYVARERSILNETELRVSHDLANAAREVARSYRLMQTNLNRWLADQRQTSALVLKLREGVVDIFILLQTQRQLLSSETDFYRSLVEYNLAIRELHRQKGSLLAYNQVQLAEGPWVGKANRDAYELGRFFTPRVHPERVAVPPPLSRGEFDPSAPVLTQDPSTLLLDSTEPLPATAAEPSESFDTPPPVQVAPLPDRSE